jgi:hypothetical protein
MPFLACLFNPENGIEYAPCVAAGATGTSRCAGLRFGKQMFDALPIGVCKGNFYHGVTGKKVVWPPLAGNLLPAFPEGGLWP